MPWRGCGHTASRAHRGRGGAPDHQQVQGAVLLVSAGVLAAAPPTAVTREVVMQPNPFACCIGMLSLCRVLYQYGFQWCRCTVHRHHTVQWFFSGAFFVSGFGFVKTNWTDSEAANNLGLVVIHEFANLVSSLASQSNFIFRSS